jgi:hypothetical protein
LLGEASHSSPLPLWERERVRGITEIAGIVTEKRFRGQKRNRRKRKSNPLLTAKMIIHILTLTTSTEVIRGG